MQLGFVGKMGRDQNWKHEKEKQVLPLALHFSVILLFSYLVCLGFFHRWFHPHRFSQKEASKMLLDQTDDSPWNGVSDPLLGWLSPFVPQKDIGSERESILWKASRKMHCFGSFHNSFKPWSAPSSMAKLTIHPDMVSLTLHQVGWVH